MFFLFLNDPGYSLRMSGHFFLSDVRGKENSGSQALGVCSRKRERRAVYVRSF